MSTKNFKTCVLISITSDIGKALAEKYSKKDYAIVGTYRTENKLDELKKIPNCHLFYCDIHDYKTTDDFVQNFEKLGLRWDKLISCPGTLEPIAKFFDCDFDEWEKSLQINSTDQLRLLHKLYPYKDNSASAVFFAGGSANKSTPNYSAYGLSKIVLTKMCEMIDSEEQNLKTFIVGPGWVKTKIHQQTINAKEEAGENYEKTMNFIESGQGTSMDDIFNCIEWLCSQDKRAVGGRNFSVVYDKWRNGGLAKELLQDSNMYKLRRFKNDFLIE